MPNSFFKRSARKGPTPLRYSMGELNMDDVAAIRNYSYKYLHETI
ncbi:MAG: hypothetical protein ABI405_08365 [Parafilimonas sp.]